MPENLLFLDFETYYDSEYSLRRMTPAEYILDPRFETILCAVKVHGVGQHEVIDGPDFPRWLAQFDPQHTTTVAFNALFDNAILAWKYGFVPKRMLDPMAMSRTLLGHLLPRFNLAGIAEHFQFPAKGNTVHKVSGMRRADIMADPAMWQSYCEYSKHDNWLQEHIFFKLYPRFPLDERRIMDMVLRCCIVPRFQVDLDLLEQHIGEVKEAKEQLLIAADNVDKATIMSTAKFKLALEKLGVDVLTKTSPTGKEVPAFAKSDDFMATLLEHSDPDVAALAAARIGLKSTLEETRCATLLRIGHLPWPNTGNAPGLAVSAGTMPIPLRYGGAHTQRLSGDWKMNMQNMPTVRGSKGKSKLRLSLKAPPGHTVVTCDLGQIEARLVAWICQCKTLLKEFADKLDPYNKLATEIFGRPVNRKLVGTPDEIMGFIGKTGILGLGYGCGKANFDTMVIRGARAQGTDISAIYNREIGDKAVDAYRRRYWEIPATWRILNQHIENIWCKATSKTLSGEIHLGPCSIRYGEIRLPSGLCLNYADPTKVFNKETGRDEFFYRYGNIRHRLYGAKLLENMVQALARIVVMNAAMRIEQCGREHRHLPEAYRFVLQAHDELVFIVPDCELETAKELIHREMVRPPSWAPDLPLTADVGQGKSYGEAK